MVRYTMRGADSAQTSSRKIYRHDIRNLPVHVATHLMKYCITERVAFVYLVFRRGLSTEEACALIDNGFCSNEDINWRILDAFSLDNSKTFINGVRYL